MSRALPFEIMLNLDNSTLYLLVSGTAIPHDLGVVSGPPESCYPPEGGEVEIDEVVLAGLAAEPVEISPLLHLLGEAAWDKLQELTEATVANLPTPPDYPEPEETIL